MIIPDESEFHEVYLEPSLQGVVYKVFLFTAIISDINTNAICLVKR